jgi:hypothetical protein
MAKKDKIEILLQDSEFTVKDSGEFSGVVHCELTNIPNEGIIVQTYLECKRDKAISLIGERLDQNLSDEDPNISVHVSGFLDGNALPDAYTLHYRIFQKWDQVEAVPKLPSNIGGQTLSVSPRGLLGSNKWKCSGNNEVMSILVHNNKGDFSVSTNIRIGKAGNHDVGVIANVISDNENTTYQISTQPNIAFKSQDVRGSENLKCIYTFFRPEKWIVIDNNNPTDIQRL